ncbi:MAG: hypothetical protein QOG72_1808 [Sphingomonadales bacterium]|jgi:hypothetical protein|nr:hypothetical protein [Sphingomonadales bacterium]
MATAALLLAILAAEPAAPAARPPAESPPIVITAKRLQDSEAVLRACLERRCPPDQDIDATLAHAENLFVAGDYRKARTTLRASLHRNRKHAARYPEPVSDLYRANAVAANHLGFEEDYERSTWGILHALKEGIPEQDARHFGARMEIAAMTGRMRGLDFAERDYASLARSAAKGGRPDIAAIAALRAAGLAYRRAANRTTRKRIEEIAASTAPETRVAANMAKLYLARIAQESGNTAEADALIRQVTGNGFKAPVLVYSPRYELAVREPERMPDETPNPAQGNPARRYGGNFDKTWIDVSFWVQTDGTVSDLEVLRKSGDPSWAAPLLKSIAGRRYAPATQAAYRLERYSYTAGYEEQTGSHLRQRSPRARVEYLDLTQDQGAPAP